ncbi:MAG: hypothetical protein J6K85_03400 [Clostridia bacterium]|nr:hypothetical protein [Clostridia bacterium]
MSKVKKQTRVELLVESIAVEKQVLVELCDDLASCRDTLDKKGAKDVTKKLEAQIKRYNGLVDEYNKLAGEKVEGAPKNLPAQIMEGSNNYNLKTVGNPTVISVNAYNPDVSVLNQKELKNYLAKSDKALNNVKSRLATTAQQKDQANGYNKVLLIINCLTYQRYIVERIAENLHVCCQILDNKKVKEFKKTLETEIANYNKLVDEYEVLTRTKLTRASTSIADDIIAGKAYTPIPSISYTANDGTTRNSDAEVAAVAASAAAAAEKATNKKKTSKKNKEVVKKSALEEKAAEQANKDLSVLAKGADFEITLLESQKDMTAYKYGKTTFDMKQLKKDVDTKVKALQKKHKEALKLEEADNARYYAVITNDPATMEIKGNDKKRAKIAAIRTKMMELLNKRDELNSKLLAIYNGSEVNLDGTSVNHTWRQVKSDAAEKCINKNKGLANKIEKLPASAGEKQRLYNLMNSNVDASSTLALSKHRLKIKEYKNNVEKKQLQKDIKDMNQLIKSNTNDINWVIKKISKRA